MLGWCEIQLLNCFIHSQAWSWAFYTRWAGRVQGCIMRAQGCIIGSQSCITCFQGCFLAGQGCAQGCTICFQGCIIGGQGCTTCFQGCVLGGQGCFLGGQGCAQAALYVSKSQKEVTPAVRSLSPRSVKTSVGHASIERALCLALEDAQMVTDPELVQSRCAPLASLAVGSMANAEHDAP